MKKTTSAMATAEAFLKKSSISDPFEWGHLECSSAQPHEFWWSDDIPLAEIALVDNRLRTPSGYLMVSTDKRLPPVLEYSRTGLPLSHQLSQVVGRSLHTSGIRRTIDKVYFLSSTELAIRLSPTRGDKEAQFIVMPDLRPVAVDIGIKLSRNPADTFAPSIVKPMWDVLTPGNPGDKPEVVLDRFKPVRYQQNCDRYDLADAACKLVLGSGDTYCSPRCIAGCVPVAWAMLLSAWKRSRIWGADVIWSGSKCWNIEWPSWGGDWNSSQCADVERTIWRIHALQNTTCSGSTAHSDTMLGSRIFAEMGLNWRWGNWENASFDEARSITSAGQPYLFTGQGIWEALVAKGKTSGTPGKVGHGVVVYGYKKADRTVLVCLGWGDSFSDKSINYDQYSQTRCAFVAGTKASGTSKMPVELD